MTHVRRMNQWTDERGEQFDEDYFTYTFVPNASSANPGQGVGGTLAAGATAVVAVNIEQDAWFEWSLTTCFANASASDDAPATVGFTSAPSLLVQITDTGSGRNLFDQPIPVGLIAGTGALPYVLPFPRRFKPTSTIIVTFTNMCATVGLNRIQLNMIGRKIFKNNRGIEPRRFKAWRDPDSGKLLAEDYFVYSFIAGSLVGAASQTFANIVEADSDFEARLLSGCQQSGVDSSSTSVFDGAISMKLKDGGSQRDLSNVALIGPGGPGVMGVPLILPVPRIFLGKTTINLTLANVTAGTTINGTFVALAGRKIFEFEGE